jgi:Cof subfamily protein (haloacid dehalogenase superfamily)
LDGTLLKNYHEIHPENLKIMKQINESGIPVCIVTGRSYNRCKHFYEELGLSTPLCVFNGAYVFSPKDDNYPNFVGGVDKEVLLKFLDTIENLYTSVVCDLEEIMYVEKFDSHDDISLIIEGNTIVEGPLKENLPTNPYSVILQAKSMEAKARIFEIVQSFPKLQVNTWNLRKYPLILEITYHKVNKGKAVKHICNYLGCTMKDAMCFGDAFNDRDMLIKSGWGVAMKNAPLEIRIVGDDVTELSDVDGGVADYLKRHVLDKID